MLKNIIYQMSHKLESSHPEAESQICVTEESNGYFVWITHTKECRHPVVLEVFNINMRDDAIEFACDMRNKTREQLMTEYDGYTTLTCGLNTIW